VGASTFPAPSVGRTAAPTLQASVTTSQNVTIPAATAQVWYIAFGGGGAGSGAGGNVGGAGGGSAPITQGMLTDLQSTTILPVVIGAGATGTAGQATNNSAQPSTSGATYLNGIPVGLPGGPGGGCISYNAAQMCGGTGGSGGGGGNANTSAQAGGNSGQSSSTNAGGTGIGNLLVTVAVAGGGGGAGGAAGTGGTFGNAGAGGTNGTGGNGGNGNLGGGAGGGGGAATGGNGGTGGNGAIYLYW